MIIDFQALKQRNANARVASSETVTESRRPKSGIGLFCLIYYLTGTSLGLWLAYRYGLSIEKGAVSKGVDPSTAKVIAIIPSGCIAALAILLTVISGFWLIASPGRLAMRLRRVFRLD